MPSVFSCFLCPPCLPIMFPLATWSTFWTAHCRIAYWKNNCSYSPNPRQPLNLGSFNVRTLVRVRQQACSSLQWTHERLMYAAPMKLESMASVLWFDWWRLISRQMNFCSPKGQGARASDHRGKAMVWTNKAETTFLSWVPSCNRSYIIILNEAVGVSKDGCV